MFVACQEADVTPPKGQMEVSVISGGGMKNEFVLTDAGGRLVSALEFEPVPSGWGML
jgi:hypothetical protein